MNRNQIQEKHKWNVEDIFESTNQWEYAYKSTLNALEKYENYQGELSKSAENLISCLTLDDDISYEIERLYVYAMMKNDENATDPKYQALVDRAGTLSVKASSASSFIVPELLAMDEAALESFYEENRELLHYKKMIDVILRAKGHVLSTEQEELLSEVGEIAGSASNIFKMLNNADIKFPTIQDGDGNDVELTKGNYSEFMESPIRDVRKTAYKALYSTYMSQKNTIAATLLANIKKDAFYARVRKFPSVLEGSLYADDVPLTVYNNLIQTVKDNFAPMYQYLQLRKDQLGVEELHMYDIYTSIVQDSEKKITYDEAYQTMIEGLSPLGKDYTDKLSEAYKDGWIDVYENEGKRGGAYSVSTYGTHPFVLLNHKDNLDSMFTLAHEMGHAMHSYYSNEHNPYLYADYTIFVAEVASTVNEVLLMNHLLNKTTDKKTRMYLINHFLEQFRGTIYRQTMFAEFEKITHERVEAGEPLTAESFSDIYLNLNKEYYGDNVVHDEEIAHEWMRIPHFYNSFYVYKYATGFSAAIAIAKRILEEDEGAVEDYKAFLKSGGTDFPIELLKIAGVDMSSSEPIEKALSMFSELVNELEELITEE